MKFRRSAGLHWCTRDVISNNDANKTGFMALATNILLDGNLKDEKLWDCKDVLYVFGNG